MGEKDLTEKILEDYNDIFADIVNVLLFDGKKEVDEHMLYNMTVHSQYKDDKEMLHEQERDVAKYWKNGNLEIAMFGIENQSKAEKRMPVRVFGYEGASYRGQYNKKNVYMFVGGGRLGPPARSLLRFFYFLKFIFIF